MAAYMRYEYDGPLEYEQILRNLLERGADCNLPAYKGSRESIYQWFKSAILAGAVTKILKEYGGKV